MKKPEGELGTRSEWWRSGYLLPLLVAIVLTVMLLVMRLAPWWSRPTDAWRVRDALTIWAPASVAPPGLSPSGVDIIAPVHIKAVRKRKPIA